MSEPITLGYARVSTTAQDLQRQLDALRGQGIRDQHLYVDKRTGATVDRPGLAALLDHAKPGDQIVVYTLDRLGRNLREMLNLVHDLTEQGIHVRTLGDAIAIDTTKDDAMSRVALLILGLFAEVERVYARERAAHARQVRLASGKPVGRGKAATDAQIAHARQLREGGMSLRGIAAATGIPHSSVARYVAGIVPAAEAAEMLAERVTAEP